MDKTLLTVIAGGVVILTGLAIYKLVIKDTQIMDALGLGAKTATTAK